VEYLANPKAIESLSMKIIAAKTGINLETPEGKIISRVIHAAGDPSLVSDLVIHPSAVTAGINTLLNQGCIFTDVSMVKSGVSKVMARKLNVNVICRINHPVVIRTANTLGCTRAKVAMEILSPMMQGGIVAIGNAPTALFQVIELVCDGKVRPELIIGTPVGFVGAAESKELLTTITVPYITVRGTKGGSAIAAAILNALFRIALQKEGKGYG
jgi:precorrin-8X/cobalt-precorrin-8 methylmutase